MPRVSNTVASKTLQILTAASGMNSKLVHLAHLEQMVLPEIGEKQIAMHNVSFDLAERTTEARYPALYVYCEKVANQLKEKFRIFSGKAYMAIEVRLSQDNMEGVERKLQLYVDAVTQVLDQNRGDWGNGMFYTGGYEATFSPVKQGGRKFIQIAKVTFDVEVSTN